MGRRALWDQVGAAIGREVFAHLQPLTDRQLRKVAAGPSARTPTNCWWVTYDLAPVVADCAKNILKSRQFARKQAKKKGPR